MYPFYTASDAEKAISMTGLTCGGEVLTGTCISTASMMVERLLGLSFPPEQCAALAARSGAFVNGKGLDLFMGALAGCFSIHVDFQSDLKSAAAQTHQMHPDGKIIVCFDDEKSDRRFALIDRVTPAEATVLLPDDPRGRGFSRMQRKRMSFANQEITVRADQLSQVITGQTFCYLFHL